MFLVFLWTLLVLPITLITTADPTNDKCKPIFVRWPRVKLNVPARLNGPFSIQSCRDACSTDQNPHKRSVPQQCSAFNHRVGPSDYANECHLFEEHSVQKTDGLIEADDRYSFYWKYCLDTNKTCLEDYGFTFLSDRYIDSAQVKRVSNSNSLENCLTECLNDDKFHCRSVAFNRTSGVCSLSEHNQLSKPAMIKINNNPNYRVDYYENNCFKIADTFHFDYKCEADGFRVKVKSQYPYTGALYGLYDFFSCRIEPQESSAFEYLFPYPDMSRNCTDSIRYKGNEMILEVVLSTDGVEPLYFITADDLTYQARCPIDPKLREKQNNLPTNQFTTTTTQLPESENENKVELASDSHKESSFLAKSQKIKMDGSWSNDDVSSSTTRKYRAMEAITIPYDEKSTTKDIFPLPLFTTTLPTFIGQQTTQPTFDQTQLNQHFGGIEALTIGTESSTTYTSPTTTEVPSTTTQQTKSTTKKSLEIINRNANTNSDAFNFSTRITFPKGDKINVNMGPTRNDGHKAASSHDLNALPPITTSTTSTQTSTTIKSTTTQKPITTSTTQAPIITTVTPAPFTLFPTITFPTFPTLPPLTMPTVALEPVTTSTVVSTISSTQFTQSTQSTQSTSKEPLPPGPRKSKNETAGQPPGSQSRKPNDSVIFDIYHNSMPAEAVVVGSRITLSFTPYFAIPPSYMSISGCQVEPINPLYDWEKEPLAIIKDGCQADHVGLVCPPQRTDYGIRVTVESFRYQTTTQLQYTCLIRICPFAPCPQTTCSSVEGCTSDDLVSRTLGLRSKRELSLEQIRAALAANPYLQQQLALSTSQSSAQMSNSLQQQLIAIGGDHLVRKRLVVVNTDEELHYYVKTGELPEHHG